MKTAHKKLGNFFKKSRLREPENFIPFIATLALMIAASVASVVFWHKDFFTFLLGVDLISFALLALALMTVVGIAGMKALVEISAGLSLIVFLAESYCGQGIVRTANSDLALKLLIAIALVYLVFNFFRVFIQGITGYFDTLTEEKHRILLKWVSTIFFLCIVGVFLGTLYEVMRPIILGLCIYQ